MCNTKGCFRLAQGPFQYPLFAPANLSSSCRSTVSHWCTTLDCLFASSSCCNSTYCYTLCKSALPCYSYYSGRVSWENPHSETRPRSTCLAWLRDSSCQGCQDHAWTTVESVTNSRCRCADCHWRGCAASSRWARDCFDHPGSSLAIWFCCFVCKYWPSCFSLSRKMGWCLIGPRRGQNSFCCYI